MTTSSTATAQNTSLNCLSHANSTCHLDRRTQWLWRAVMEHKLKHLLQGELLKYVPAILRNNASIVLMSRNNLIESEASLCPTALHKNEIRSLWECPKQDVRFRLGLQTLTIRDLEEKASITVFFYPDPDYPKYALKDFSETLTNYFNSNHTSTPQKKLGQLYENYEEQTKPLAMFWCVETIFELLASSSCYFIWPSHVVGG